MRPNYRHIAFLTLNMFKNEKTKIKLTLKKQFKNQLSVSIFSQNHWCLRTFDKHFVENINIY